MSKAPGPYAPPPYGLPANGTTYFKVLPGINGLAAAWLEGLRLMRDLGTLTHPAAKAKRQLLARHLADMEGKIRAGELLVTDATDDFVRQRIAATQVRPDNPHGPVLINAIKSHPIPYPDLPAFAVGQVDLGILDKRAKARTSTKPYWRSQEWGSAHNVGRQIGGSFMPGAVAPDQSMFRVHPIFQAGVGGGILTIQRPIPERAFLRSGVMQGALLRQRLWRQIERDAIAEVTRIVTLGGPVGRRRP